MDGLCNEDGGELTICLMLLDTAVAAKTDTDVKTVLDEMIADIEKEETDL